MPRKSISLWQRKPFSDDQKAEFVVGDAFDIRYPDNSFDIVVSNNLLLHLPSVKKPIEELCRVAKKTVVFRTLVGKRSFIIKQSGSQGDEFNDNGEPLHYNFYNIYSKAYISHILSQVEKVDAFEISEDTQFNPQHIQEAGAEYTGAYDITSILGKWQINGYILQPWAFVCADLKKST